MFFQSLALSLSAFHIHTVLLSVSFSLKWWDPISASECCEASFCSPILSMSPKKHPPCTYILLTGNIPLGSHPKHSYDFLGEKNMILGLFGLAFSDIFFWLHILNKNTVRTTVLSATVSAKGLPLETSNFSQLMSLSPRRSYESISRRVRGPWPVRACLRSYGVSWSSCRGGATTVVTFSFPRRSCEMWRTPSKEQPTSQLPTMCR